MSESKDNVDVDETNVDESKMAEDNGGDYESIFVELFYILDEINRIRLNKVKGENKNGVIEELIINLNKLKNNVYLEQFINLAIIEPEPESESEYNESEFKYLIKFIKGLKNDDDYIKHVTEVIDRYIDTLNELKNNSSLIGIKDYITKIKISFTLATSQYDISKSLDELLYQS